MEPLAFLLIAFLLGLAIGLALLAWKQVQFHHRLLNLSQSLGITPSPRSRRLSEQLKLALIEQQQACQEQQQQLKTYKLLLQSAPIGYVQVDEDNQLTWCNPQACSLLGIQYSEQAKPRLLLEIVRSYELDQLIEQTRNVQQPSQQEWTFHLVSPDMSALSRQIVSPLRGYGLPLAEGHVGVFLENRQEAVMLAQQRDRWTSDVAHELKTPLTSIRLVAETLRSRLDLPLRGWIDRLLSETIRLGTLVQDLLDLSQMETKAAGSLSMKPFNLPELIQSAWISLEPLARKKHIQLDYIGANNLVLQADEHRLYRVLINLLDNSIKYSPPRQHIRIQANLQSTADPPFISLGVIDAGPGFPESDLPYVFERFYRADPSRSRPKVDASEVGIEQNRLVPPLDPLPGSQHTSSSGLGLAIVRQIIEAHRGSVSASNHPETGGAWIQIQLPCQQPTLATRL